MERFTCVVFDVDGTLTRTNDLIFASFNHILEKYLSRTMTPLEIVGLFGPPEEGALRQVLPESMIAGAMDDLCEYYEEHHDRLASLHDGLREGIEALRAAGVRLAVFTGKGRRTAAITLSKFGLMEAFPVVISGNDVERHKPAPDGIHAIMNSFSVAPQSVLMVGDSLGDLQAARGAGVLMAAVLWDSYDRERVLGGNPEYTFETVPEFFGWLLPRVSGTEMKR
jgi:HAD superfamily hydrolase (TIGR01549 family)